MYLSVNTCSRVLLSTVNQSFSIISERVIQEGMSLQSQ